MKFQKIVNLFGIASDDKDLPRYVSKKWIEVYDQSEKITTLTKKLELKHQCFDQIYVILAMHTLLLKEILLLKVIIMLINIIKILYLKIMHHYANKHNNANKHNKNLVFKNNAPLC